MRSFHGSIAILSLAALSACSRNTTGTSTPIPHLRKQGTATQLVVDGKPFLMLAGELRNSSSSSSGFLKPIWSRLVAMHLNTVLSAVQWELLEPKEGQFDSAFLDSRIQGAQSHNLRLVFLWFGSWKNGASSYIPAWVKTNQDRFPRVQHKDGKGMEALSTLSAANRDADARAFAALMRHIKEVDTRHTVVMIQVENEVGVLGDPRNRCEAANKAFEGPAPKELLDYIGSHKDTLHPQLGKAWEAAGSKTSGTWEHVFGKTPYTDEIFMAWNYSSYMNRVAAAGKAEYPLPIAVVVADEPPQKIALGGYVLEVSYARTRRLPASAPAPPPMPVGLDRAGALFIALGPDEYLAAGSGPVSVAFSPNTPGAPAAGIFSIDEGTYVDGRWVAGRRLNGDENGQGKFLRIGGGNSLKGSIQRVKLYRYR